MNVGVGGAMLGACPNGSCITRRVGKLVGNDNVVDDGGATEGGSHGRGGDWAGWLLDGRGGGVPYKDWFIINVVEGRWSWWCNSRCVDRYRRWCLLAKKEMMERRDGLKFVRWEFLNARDRSR